MHDVMHGPAGKTWLNTGLKPDRELALTEAELKEARLEDDGERTLLLDRQLAAAVALLEAKTVSAP